MTAASHPGLKPGATRQRPMNGASHKPPGAAGGGLPLSRGMGGRRERGIEGVRSSGWGAA